MVFAPMKLVLGVTLDLAPILLLFMHPTFVSLGLCIGPMMLGLFLTHFPCKNYNIRFSIFILCLHIQLSSIQANKCFSERWHHKQDLPRLSWRLECLLLFFESKHFHFPSLGLEFQELYRRLSLEVFRLQDLQPSIYLAVLWFLLLEAKDQWNGNTFQAKLVIFYI